jgi:hypothetical protein
VEEVDVCRGLVSGKMVEGVEGMAVLGWSGGVAEIWRQEVTQGSRAMQKLSQRSSVDYKPRDSQRLRKVHL